jgi:large subunit ribosomal protein L19e
LRKYRSQQKVDKHLYHELYLKSKGNVFKNKKVLMEYIHKAKSEQVREKALEAQAEARKEKSNAKRTRKDAKKAGKSE